jgi:non-heme chloroperoxidase
MNFITSDNVEIFYEDNGEGKPLVFIHGWSMDSTVFYYQKKNLNKFRVITVDLRGHGKSAISDKDDYSFNRMGTDILELLQYLKLEKIVMVGWSAGVSIILDQIEELQKYVQKFVFLSGAPQFIQNDDFEFGMRKIIADRLLKNIQKDWLSTIKNFSSLMFHSEKLEQNISDKLSEIFEQTRNNNKQKVLELTLNELYKNTYLKKLDTINKPTLIITGELDRICLKEASVFMSQKIRFSQLIIIPKTGHMPFFVFAKEVNKLIENFVVT